MNPLLLIQLLAPMLASAGTAAPQSVAPPNAPAAPAQPIDPAVLAALVVALRPPEPEPVRMPGIASFIGSVIVLAFFATLAALGALLVMGHEPNPAIYIGLGAEQVLVSIVVCFLFSSSWGSREKDAQRRSGGQGNVIPFPVPGQPPPPAIPPPEPAPGPEPGPQPAPAPAQPPVISPDSRILTLKGKCSWFGGPDDPERFKTPDLAFYNESQAAKRPDLFSAGPGGLFGRLNPNAHYIACRWDYHQTPADWLRSCRAKVTAVKTGRSFNDVFPADWGPNANTGRVADLSHGLLRDLGIDTDDEVLVEVPLPGGSVKVASRPASAQSGLPSGADILALARTRVGERYVNVLVPKDDRNWHGPWDCAEFASWLVYQVAGIVYGCTNDSDPPAAADAYTGAWKNDAQTKGKMVSVSEAAGTPGAFILRFPPAPGAMGHIAVSDGQGGTIEAASSSTGVVAGKVSGRRWDTGVLVPGIDYSGAHLPVVGPSVVYAIGQPNMDSTKVKEIQSALVTGNALPLEVDGEYGPETARAVASFQRIRGLIPDGEVGPDTAAALGITL